MTEQNFREQKIENPLRPPNIKLGLNGTIGQLDRDLSELLYWAEDPDLDAVDAQTLKHHADDLIGVGQKALEVLKARGLE